MDASSPPATAPASAPPDAASHLRLALLRAALALLLRATRLLAPLDDLLARFPALLPHLDAAAALGLEGCTLDTAIARLDEALWQEGAAAAPLARLRDALGLAPADMDLFLRCALADDDPALAPLFDALRGHAGRCTAATLAHEDGSPPDALQALLAAGFLREESEARWRTIAVPPGVWQAAQGVATGYLPPQALPEWDALILPAALRATADAARARHPPSGLCWLLRGHAGSGRRTLAGALARSAGLGLLHAPQGDAVQLAACATLLGAMPLIDLFPASGEQVVVPALTALRAPLAVRLSLQGGVAPAQRVPCWLELGLPDRAERQRHWERSLRGVSPDPRLLDLRWPRAQIHRIAALAGKDAAAASAEADAQCRHVLEGLAQRVAPPHPQEQLAVADALQRDFDLLLARCRHREALPQLLPAAFGASGGAGVRALFKGPSGTGKTLAARRLAAALLRPLYRVDLAATVSKYIGETERNLERVFAAAEALDVVLLLDEGDALMAGRTGVGNANDRYANLETNFLLQRLEHYDGILVVTTNAAERIDAAFARRMDATLDFALPDAPTRARLWQLHLPAGHAVTPGMLDEVALRCTLSGGQVRHAALHATLLALQRDARVGDTEVAQALRREYARAGQACPSLQRSP